MILTFQLLEGRNFIRSERLGGFLIFRARVRGPVITAFDTGGRSIDHESRVLPGWTAVNTGNTPGCNDVRQKHVRLD